MNNCLFLEVTEHIPKEKYQLSSITVFLGSALAIRIAASIASTEGLQRIGGLDLNLLESVVSSVIVFSDSPSASSCFSSILSCVL